MQVFLEFTENNLLCLSSPQIYHEARKFGRAYNLTACCVYGGGSKWEQSKAVKEGCEILVATPVGLYSVKTFSLVGYVKSWRPF